MSVVFKCKLCGKEHPSIEINEFGLALLPESITTERDSNQHWYFCCVKCTQAKTMPA